MRLKALAELLLAYGGPAAAASRRVRRRALVLAYHNVVPRGGEPAGDRSLHIGVELFRRHLDVIQRHASVVPLSGLMRDDPEGEEGGRLRVAVTFDDAYRGAVLEGVAELSRRGLPCTVFVSPGCLDGHAFWWDRYPELPGGTAGRTSALERCRGRDEEVRQWLEGELGMKAVDVPSHAHSATSEELEAATRDHGVTLGAHTWSHPNLARLEPEELEPELTRPLAWLGEHFPEAMRPMLAFPYGCSSPVVEQAAAQAGYTACFRILGGFLPVQVGDQRHRLPRTNVPATLSPAGLRLRLAGLLP